MRPKMSEIRKQMHEISDRKPTQEQLEELGSILQEHYKNEPFNTPEQKLKEAINKIESLEARIKEFRKYAGHWQSCNILNPYSQDECNCGFDELLEEPRANN